jgi:hypothetical protein
VQLQTYEPFQTSTDSIFTWTHCKYKTYEPFWTSIPFSHEHKQV